MARQIYGGVHPTFDIRPATGPERDEAFMRFAGVV